MAAETIAQIATVQEVDPIVRVPSALDPRVTFMRGEGCMLYTDVNAQVLAAMGTIAVEPLIYKPIFYEISGPDNISQSEAALLEVTTHLIHTIPRPSPTTPRLFYDQFGVSKTDLYAARQNQVFASGFGDMTFPWHFSAGLASAAVHSFVEAKKITPDQADNLTLGDWANVIGSGWFSELVHSMAFTANGTWAAFGENPDDYIGRTLKSYMVVQDVLQDNEEHNNLNLFDVHEELYDDLIYLTAALNQGIRTILRERMQNSEQKSTGCPVARKAVRMPAIEMKSNTHIQNLVNLGIVTVRDTANNKVVIEQEYTAIDRTLAFFADQLDQYENQYGQPIISSSCPTIKGSVIHETRPLTNALRREA